MICVCCGIDKEKDMFRDNRKNVKNDKFILEEIDNKNLWHLIPDELYLI